MAYAMTHKEYRKKLRIKNPEIKPIQKYKLSNIRLMHIHKPCGHKWFITPTNALSGYSCPKCNHPSKRKTPEEYKQQVKNIHGNKIKVIDPYITALTSIRFKCKKGHIFTCSPRSILNAKPGYGCPKCAIKIRKKSLRIGLKNYNKLLKLKFKNRIKCIGNNYKNNESKILHKCFRGHKFISTAIYLLDKRVSKLNGCPSCSAIQSGVAIEAINKLSKKSRLFFRHAENKGEWILYYKEKRIKLDGFNRKYKIAVEFHGDYYHGGKRGCRNMELYQKTLKRDRLIRKMGYNLIVIWEWDYRSSPKDCINRCNRKIKNILLQSDLFQSNHKQASKKIRH